MAAALLAAPNFVAAQVGSAPTAPATDAAARPYAFDVVSIRPAPAGGQPHFGATQTGYQATNLSLMASVLMAYLPLSGEAYYTGGRIKGAPDWAQSEPYTIEAKVAEQDLPAWQKPDEQKVMLRAMLQTMLADRLKLVVHRESRKMPVYELVLGKGGPQFRESTSDAPHPSGISLPSGGTLLPSRDGQTLTFYDVPMASLTPVLANFAGRPVQDKTGLTGRYDLTLERDSPDPSMAGTASAAPAPPTYSVDALGLRLQKSTASVDTLVIDHMERPSGN